MNKSKILSIFGSVVWAAASLFMLSACSDDELSGEKDADYTAKGYKYNVVVGAGEGTKAAPSTKSLNIDEDYKILSTWDATDKLMLYNLGDNDRNTDSIYSAVAPDKHGGVTAHFDGTLETVNKISSTDNIAFFVPGSVINDRRKVNPVTAQTTDTEFGGAKTKMHAVSNQIRKYVLVDLSNQDGTLEGIDENYDIQWGISNPTQIIEEKNSIYFNAVKLQRKIAIWKLELATKDGDLTDLDSVYIGGITSADIFDLSKGDFGGATEAEKRNVYTIKPQKGAKALWIAVIPGTYDKSTGVDGVTVAAYKDGKIYTRRFNGASFSQGKISYNRVTLNKGPQPYIDVQDTKWATGNFIVYNDGVHGDYYGIAPTQWWYSGYKEPQAGSPEPKIGQQHWYTLKYSGKAKFNPNDVDLFGWGDIKNIRNGDDEGYLKLSASKFLGLSNSGNNWEKTKDKTPSLCHTMFTSRENENQKTNNTQTEDRTKAVAGDVVYFYTRDKKNTYRYPTYNEVNKLYYKANMYWAYCYTDAGNKSYGVYFTTCNTGNRSSFLNGKDYGTFDKPMGTGIDSLDVTKGDDGQYVDVTKQIKAGIGLFLPFTGQYNKSDGNIQYRYFRGNIQGMYMAASFGTSGSNRTCVFLGCQTHLTTTAKANRGSIRPVYDEADNLNKENIEDTPYAGFEGLY